MRFNRKIWMCLASIFILFGLIGTIQITINGEQAMGTNNYVAWGALIAGYVFFVVAGTGLSLVSSLGHVFKMKQFEVIAKRAVLGAIILILMGFAVIAIELGKPFNLVYILFSPNFKSAIFWMGASYGLYLILLIVEFYFMYTNAYKKSRIVGIFVLIVAILAYGNLGTVFGYLIARPFWHGPYLSIHLILTAFLVGTAILSIMFYIFDKFNKAEKLVTNGHHLVTHLGKLLALCIGAIMFFTTFKLLTGGYGSVPGSKEAVMSLLTGPLAPHFWIFEIGFGMLIPFAILMTKDGFQPKRVFLASVFAVIGMFFMRINLVFAGQIIPIEIVDGAVEASYRTFSISWAEWAVIIGAIGGAILLYLLGERFLNLNMGPDEKGSTEPNKEKQIQTALYMKR